MQGASSPVEKERERERGHLIALQPGSINKSQNSTLRAVAKKGLVWSGSGWGRGWVEGSG